MWITEPDGTKTELNTLALKRDSAMYLGVQHLAPAAQRPARTRRYPATVEGVPFTTTTLRYAATGELASSTRSRWSRPELSWALAKLRLHRQTHDMSSALPTSMRDMWAVALFDRDDDDVLQTVVVHPTIATEADVVQVFELSARLAVRRQWSSDLAHERSRLRLERTFAEDRELRLA
ncbi:hypothetical protein [Antrihabitans stalactiti]|uniref:Uncharacterized protein n=1 Tax=Antrihabitans stalactiti TaxID=2584121 RepID=A0A848KDM7_9NOCA|nr:hypothetical protein [Antrihabitans stalactiti]NMN94812.1 hypothetical protein [Antrihabitans stalactiti]